MNIAYFDCFSGIAGDMALAALLDCGVPLDQLKTALASLPVEGWDIEAENVLTSGIHAKSVSITLDGLTDEQELAQKKAAPHGHHHDHDHDHDHHAHHDEHGHSHHHHEHDHTHDHEEDHVHEHHHHDHHHGRSMAEIREIILASDLSNKVKTNSLKIFEKIAVAEAYLHHSTPDEIHFHEIGGVDSLIDIVGVAWCLEYLGVEEIYCSALPHSTGFVDCAHGRMPVPAPATLEILKDAPWTPTDLRGELVTPTGAGIVAALATEFGTQPAIKISQIGLGAGKKQLPDRPNIVRVSVGQKVATSQSRPVGLEWTTLALLETNIDDMNPQLFDAVFDALLAARALDVWTTPIGMKKNRSAQTLSVLCELADQNDVLAVIARETTTLGIRVSTLERAALRREMTEVKTPFGSVRVKVGQWEEIGLRRSHPEWDDVKRLAAQAGVPAREVYESAKSASLES